MEIEKAKFTPFGLEKVTDNNDEPVIRDRCIVLIKDGLVLYQPRCRKIVQINTTVVNNKCIAIDAPGMNTLKIQIPPEENAPIYDIKEKDLCSVVRRSARSLGKEADHWFSKFLLAEDSGIKSGYCDGTPENYFTYFCRHANIFFMNLIRDDNLTTFVQRTDLLLLNKSSITDIRSRIETYDPENPITEDRFRGNILVDGPDIRPYDEDAWSWMKIGDKMVTRYRTRVSKAMGIGPAVGIYLEVMKHEGVIQVGDPVFVSTGSA